MFGDFMLPYVRLRPFYLKSLALHHIRRPFAAVHQFVALPPGAHVHIKLGDGFWGSTARSATIRCRTNPISNLIFKHTTMALYPLPKVVQQPVRYDRRLSLPFRITGHAARAGREQGSLAASTYTSACSLVERDTKRPMRHVRRPFAAVHQAAAFPLEVHVPAHVVGNLCPVAFQQIVVGRSDYGCPRVPCVLEIAQPNAETPQPISTRPPSSRRILADHLVQLLWPTSCTRRIARSLPTLRACGPCYTEPCGPCADHPVRSCQPSFGRSHPDVRFGRH